MEARIVLKAIENSIVAFSLFVKTEELDPQKPWWRIRSVKLSFQPLEDPRDFNLLCDITNSIQKVTICNWTHTHTKHICEKWCIYLFVLKRKAWIKELEGMKSWYKLRGRRMLKECDDQKKEIMFMTIEMKLVTRVLKMSTVSTSQLKWCKQKLDNIDFMHRKLVRTSLLSCPLFPSS